ncbi:MFS transporter [Secundilactobacillus collinoides]|uniref:MFS transporter n=1 Tax=Secundilactobacillus collinoides TaxID=33960 RepID=UPI0006D206A8|nr:MFS transporter [Secundilactobacillus collinoides]
MRTKTATVLLLCTVFIMLLNQTLMTTAMPVIASSLNISVGLGQWLTTGYVLILGVISPMTAQLITKFSSRHLFLSILAIFLVGTIITMLNSNFWFLLLGRLIQACAGGILISFVQVSLLILHRPEKRGTVLGIQALVITCAPALGPTLAGIVIKLENWQALFFIPISHHVHHFDYLLVLVSKLHR